MSMDKAIEHGKEHRKPWRGSAKSKNIDRTCCNHGSCDYCKFNRLHTFTKNILEAEQKMEDWELTKTTWYVTYTLYDFNGNTRNWVESFDSRPSYDLIQITGIDIATELGYKRFSATRGKEDWNGNWIEFD